MHPAKVVARNIIRSSYLCHEITFSFKAILPTATDVTVAWSVRLYVCVSSVTLVHPAKAVARNEMLGTLVWSQVTLY